MAPLDSSASFYDVLRAAIADIAENGYLGPGQIDVWVIRLREAAERLYGRGADVDREVREALGQIYRRFMQRGIKTAIPGVGQYTLVQVAPQLRAELDRRILASADLIRLNRRAAIEKTLQRFSGWSTSIPAGGAVIDKREVRVEIGKSVTQAKFEARRVAIDQGHKLVANVANIVAQANGAIAVEWHSHWRQAGYDYRKDHKERDGRIYAMRGSWAIEKGLMRAGSAGYLDEVTMFGQEPYCRCYGRYFSSLRDLPADMLTEKGRAALKAVTS